MAWRYIELKSLEEAGETEEVCACYPNSNNNTSGYKHEEHMKIAEKDAQEGKCRLLVWRDDHVSGFAAFTGRRN